MTGLKCCHPENLRRASGCLSRRASCDMFVSCEYARLHLPFTLYGVHIDRRKSGVAEISLM